MRPLIAIIVCIVSLPLLSPAQDQLPSMPDQFFRHIASTSTTIQQKLDHHTQHYWKKITRLEQKLQRKLAKKDSLAAIELFPENTIARSKQLSTRLTGGSLYIPTLDTLGTTLKFLQANPAMFRDAGLIREKITAGIGSIHVLEDHLQQAENLKKLWQQRQQYLTQKLQSFGFVKELKQLDKQVYYYTQQVNEYKTLLKDPGKASRKVLDMLSKTDAFQNFMRRNSRLASLFRLPGNDDPSTYIRYASLQTRDQVNTLLQQQLAAGGEAARQQLQQQLQTAQAEMSKLKDKLLSSSPTGGGGEGAWAATFKPNNQKTKTFKQRLELGSNLQSQKATSYFPVTTDLGLSLGYKLNDQSVVGLGASYKVGWGSGWNNIRVTHQGAGIRSFVDYKMKGSFWLSGGFEYNYRPRAAAGPMPFSSPTGGGREGAQVWQQSALIGLSKKYQFGKKYKGRMQLLWDFLSYQQIPRAQPIVFRVGYDLK